MPFCFTWTSARKCFHPSPPSHLPSSPPPPPLPPCPTPTATVRCAGASRGSAGPYGRRRRFPRDPPSRRPQPAAPRVRACPCLAAAPGDTPSPRPRTNIPRAHFASPTHPPTAISVPWRGHFEHLHLVLPGIGRRTARESMDHRQVARGHSDRSVQLWRFAFKWE